MNTRIKSMAVILVLWLCSCASTIQEPVWIDVRTVEEFSADHIEGDINMPLAELDVEQLAEMYGKDSEIMLYCRSGNRAGQAKTRLEEAGFTNVVNAGGITDVRELRDLAQASKMEQ